MKKRLVLFASGSGSNATNVYNHFKDHPTIEVVALFCNNAQAGIIGKIPEIPLIIFDRQTFNSSNDFLKLIFPYNPDLIALLGFLWKVPEYLINDYKIINLHPALLPKFGGRGMWGHFVHEAVKLAGESETGITIHWVNSEYDKGQIIAQYKCQLDELDTAETIAQKIHLLEQQLVPITIESILNKFI